MNQQETMRSHGTGPRDDEGEIESLRHRIQELQSEVEYADKRLRALVRDKPLVALIGAVAAGFFLGRIISRV
jgi:hypothetical protein